MSDKKPATRPRPGGPKHTPEGRQRLADIARQRHANGELDARKNGALGGRGNTREKRRAAQELAEHLRTPEMIEKMRRVIDDGLDSEQAMGTRLKTLEIATSIEKDEAKLTLQEEQAEAAHISREDAIAALKAGLSKGRMRVLVSESHHLEQENMEDAEVVDGEVTD